MATLPAFFKRSEAPGAASGAARRNLANTSRTTTARAGRDPYLLRALPQEDVFFFCKHIDNSRLEREPDPKSRGACWSTIGAACLFVAMLTGALFPSLSNTLAGYKLEALRAEQRRLIDERRALDLKEASLLSPERMRVLAERNNLVTPANEQVFHLDGRPGSTVAMAK
jgi:hypothetical protein